MFVRGVVWHGQAFAAERREFVHVERSVFTQNDSENPLDPAFSLAVADLSLWALCCCRGHFH